MTVSISTMIHGKITELKHGAVPASILVNLDDNNSYICFFTGDQLLANHIVDGFKAYEARVLELDIADREADNIASGQDVDEPDAEDDGEAEF
jgi:hypothetical protein